MAARSRKKERKRERARARRRPCACVWPVLAAERLDARGRVPACLTSPFNHAAQVESTPRAFGGWKKRRHPRGTAAGLVGRFRPACSFPARTVKRNVNRAGAMRNETSRLDRSDQRCHLLQPRTENGKAAEDALSTYL